MYILLFIETGSSDVFNVGDRIFMEYEFYPRTVLYSDVHIFTFFYNADKQSINLFIQT
jgi:hypothetical protein